MTPGAYILHHTQASIDTCVRSMLRTDARYRWLHNFTGRAPRTPANDDDASFFSRWAALIARQIWEG